MLFITYCARFYIAYYLNFAISSFIVGFCSKKPFMLLRIEGLCCKNSTISGEISYCWNYYFNAGFCFIWSNFYDSKGSLKLISLGLLDGDLG